MGDLQLFLSREGRAGQDSIASNTPFMSHPYSLAYLHPISGCVAWRREKEKIFYLTFEEPILTFELRLSPLGRD